jgi:serine protease AprX
MRDSATRKLKISLTAMFRTLVVVSLLLLPQSFLAAANLKEFGRIYDRDGNKIFENLEERMAGRERSEKIPAIVLFKDGSVGVLSQRILNKTGVRRYMNIPAAAASLSVDEIRELATDPQVEHVELDARVKACLDTARVSFGVQKTRTQFGYTGNQDGFPTRYTTQDIVIAMIDTGIANHPDLRDKVLFWKDYVNARNQPYDDNGHGTHVAGVAAGAGIINPRFSGVAPGAALVVLKVLDSNGNGSLSDAIEAVDDVITRKFQFNIRILNLSLATSGSSNGRDALSQACNRAVANGISVVVAAGNEGPNPRTIGSPSAAASVITVGAGADPGEKGFYLAEFSSRGPTADGRIKPDLWAPGIRLRSPRASGGYSDATGTSFSTPFVAGVIALMLDARPSLTPGSIKQILTQTAAHWLPGGKSNETGAGRLQAYQAITRAASIQKNLQPPAIPDLFYRRANISDGETQTYNIPVASLRFPIAITCIIQNFLSADVDIELISPSGTVVRRAATLDRQETLTFSPSQIGTYRLNVKSLGGNTFYVLDLSTDLVQ